MNNTLSFGLIIVLLMLSLGCESQQTVNPGNNNRVAHQQGRKPFNVYAFIAYGGYTQNGQNVNASHQQLQQYLHSFGIHKLNLIYETRLLDYPNGDKKNGIPNIHHIDSLGILAKNEPDIPVSLDLEEWNRFDTVKTPARFIAVINEFRKVNSISQVGLYATVPQNTYAYSEAIHKNDKLNKAYSVVAAAVDYFSPSLYNYNGSDTSAWTKNAVYNLNACKQYQFPAKKILPYITPEVTQNGVTTLLSYDEMWNRLQILYNLGADGCLIWTSSKTRDVNGNKVYVDVNSGWAKAVKDFIARHPNPSSEN
ncbi:MAG: hypothetical protein Q8908_13230 [Bacteroidota bacterium]|nr:hypothetical protein [Bacteroidota bacterium]